MTNSTTTRKPGKGRQRPQAVLDRLKALGVDADFPLFPSANGLWAKKVRKRLHYFGPHADPQAALAKWLDEKDELKAGRTPRDKTVEGLTMRALCNAFLTSKRRVLESGEISHRSFQEYYNTCEKLIEAFGKDRLISDLRPTDFETYRAKVAEKWAAIALGNEVQRVRCVFKYGFDSMLMDVPMRYGPMFKKPKPKEMRLARQAAPAKMFSAEEVKALLTAAKPQMKAMILLGINCGFGNSDIAGLLNDHIDLKAGVIEYARNKTGIPRRATLWAETVAAIKAAKSKLPAPKNPADAECVFVTKYGERWVRGESVELPDGKGFRLKATDSVGLEFGKLLRSVKVKQGRKSVSLKREGVNFYALRHVFRTVAGQAKDAEAVDFIMGHSDADDMADQYNEWEMDKNEGNPRLRRVTDHVHKWLYGA